MSSGCGDVLSLADLQTAKKHQIFEAEVITGKSGGVAGGADIDYATNAVTGQTQKTLPAVLRDAGFSSVPWDFSAGGTLTVNDRDKVVYDPVSKTWYSYAGTLPVVVPAGFNPVGSADWKPQTDPYLRDDLSAANGGTIIGAVDSVAMFYGLTPVGGGNVYLNGWYGDGTDGGGVFYYDAAVPTADHDGGIIISPSVPYTSDANSADYVSGVGETNPSGFGCWVRRGVTEVTGAMYGMSGNPTPNIDLSPHFNKAISYAGKNALGFQFPGNVVNLKSPVSIPMHQREGGKVAYIRGADEKSSVVNILATATSSSNYGIYFDGSLSTFSAFPVENITIKSVDSSGNRADWSGFGILFNKCIRLVMRNVLIDGFEIGCKLADSLYLKFDNCRFTYNKTAIQGRLGELSGPNAVALYRCDFQNNAEFCIENQHAHAWKIDSCTFETNGGKSYANSTPITFNSCVQFALIGGAGATAVHFDNCYFENNNSGKDISFYVNRNFNQIMNVSSCIFNHNSDTELASRILVQSNLSDMSAGLQAILNLNGNGFYNSGSASTAFRNVQFAVPSTFGVSHLVFNDSGNKYSLSSPFSGMEKVQRIGPSQPVAKAIVNATGVGTAMQNVASISKTGTGVYAINFTGSIAAAVVTITFDGGSGRYASVTKSSDYSVTVSTFNNTGGQVDLGFNLLAV